MFFWFINEAQKKPNEGRSQHKLIIAGSDPVRKGSELQTAPVPICYLLELIVMTSFLGLAVLSIVFYISYIL